MSDGRASPSLATPMHTYNYVDMNIYMLAFYLNKSAAIKHGSLKLCIIILYFNNKLSSLMHGLISHFKESLRKFQSNS